MNKIRKFITYVLVIVLLVTSTGVPSIPVKANTTSPTSSSDVFCDYKNIWVHNKTTGQVYVLGDGNVTHDYNLQETQVSCNDTGGFENTYLRKLTADRELITYNEHAFQVGTPYIAEKVLQDVDGDITPYHASFGEIPDKKLRIYRGFFTTSAYSIMEGPLRGDEGRGISYFELKSGKLLFRDAMLENPTTYTMKGPSYKRYPEGFLLLGVDSDGNPAYKQPITISGNSILDITPVNAQEIRYTNTHHYGDNSRFNGYIHALLDDGRIASITPHPELTDLYALRRINFGFDYLTGYVSPTIKLLDTPYRFKHIMSNYAIDTDGYLHFIETDTGVVSEPINSTKYTTLSTLHEHCCLLYTSEAETVSATPREASI